MRVSKGCLFFGVKPRERKQKTAVSVSNETTDYVETLVVCCHDVQLPFSQAREVLGLPAVSRYQVLERH